MRCGDTLDLVARGSQNPSARQTGSARCAVWHAPGVAPPEDLLRALSGRGVWATAVTSAYLALAECCAVPSDRAALVMVDPEGSLPDGRVRAIVEAMGKYAPSSPIWVYDERSTHRLRAYVPAPTPSITSGPIRRPMSPPRLRLAGDPGIEPGAPMPVPELKGAGSLLTDEELAMLLSDEPSEPGIERGES